MTFSVLLAILLLGNLGATDTIRVEKRADLTDILERHKIFEPQDVAASDDGSIYVFDDGAKKVHVLDDTFAHQLSFGREGPGPGEFDRTVSHLLFAPGGQLVAVEKWDRTVHFFSSEGDFQDSFFIQKDPRTAGTPQDRGFGIPLDVAVDDDANVYLTDRVWYYSQDLVHVFDRTGRYVKGGLPQKSFETLRKAREKQGSVEQEQRYIAQMMNERQRKLAVDNNGNLVVGQRGAYVLEKYTPNFERLWRTERDFSPVKPPHAVQISHMGEKGYRSGMGEGAVADIAISDDNTIFVSVGCFDGHLEEKKHDQLSHWIDVFSEEGEHMARLLEDELPPLPLRRGYRIDVQGSRLLVLGGTELWVYDIVRDA